MLSENILCFACKGWAAQHECILSDHRFALISIWPDLAIYYTINWLLVHIPGHLEVQKETSVITYMYCVYTTWSFFLCCPLSRLDSNFGGGQRQSVINWHTRSKHALFVNHSAGIWAFQNIFKDKTFFFVWDRVGNS